MVEDMEDPDDAAVGAIAAELLEILPPTKIAIKLVDVLVPYARSSLTIELVLNVLATDATYQVGNPENFDALAECFKKHSRTLLAANPANTTEAIGMLEDVHHEELEITLEPGVATMRVRHIPDHIEP